MIVPGPFRSISKMLRGDVSPALIVLSVMLAFTFGLVPGFQGLHVGLLAVALILNVNIGMFIFFAGLGKALALAAAPLLFQTGQFVQESMAFVPRTMSRIPVFAISDFDCYAVCGGLLLGPLVGLVVGLLMARSVTAFRHTWLNIDERSPKFQAWRSKRWVRVLDWLLLGRSVADARAALNKKPKYVRMPGVIAAIVLLVAGGAALSAVKDRIVPAAVADSLTKANGAEVDVARLNVEPLSGEFGIQGLQMTDPERPQNNRFALGQMKASVRLWRLLCGTFVVSELNIASLDMDKKRDRIGTVLPRDNKPDESADEKERSAFDPARYGLPSADAETLDTYLKNARQIREHIEKLAKWLPQRDPDHPVPPPKSGPPESYLAYLRARSPAPRTPRVLIERLVIENVPIPDEEFGRSRVTVSNLSDAPDGAALPVTIELKSNEKPALLAVTFHYDASDGGATLTGRMEGIDLRRIQQRLSDKNPVTFAGGTCNAGFEGRISRSAMDVRIDCKTKDMKLASGGHGGMFGMDPGLSSEVTKALDHLETSLRLVGPLAAPRLAFDTASLKKGFNDALVSAGKGQLAKQLDQLGGGKLGGAKIGEAIQQGDAGKAAQQAIGDLLGGKQQNKPAKK